MPFDVIDPKAEIKLVAVDMDGTFLDAQGQIPDAAWPIIEQLQQRGVTFAPASGRQYARLAQQFGQLDLPLTIIAENGTLVMRGDQELYSNVIAAPLVEGVITLLREQGAALAVNVVRCGRHEGYLEQPSAQFAAAVAPYYARTRAVRDLLQVHDQTIKLAIYCPGRAAAVAQLLEPVAQQLQVVISGENWVDVMNLEVHKGVAVASLQERLGIGAQHTVVFGDYLNDLQMLDTATYSFAMANAHPQIHAAARLRAPSNTEHGVLQVLRAWLDGASTLSAQPPVR